MLWTTGLKSKAVRNMIINIGKKPRRRRKRMGDECAKKWEEDPVWNRAQLMLRGAGMTGGFDIQTIESHEWSKTNLASSCAHLRVRRFWIRILCSDRLFIIAPPEHRLSHWFETMVTRRGETLGPGLDVNRRQPRWHLMTERAGKLRLVLKMTNV